MAKNPLLIPRPKKQKFVDLPKSAGILDDHAQRKVVHTKELYHDGTEIGSKFLKLDASNDPITSNLEITGKLTLNDGTENLTINPNEATNTAIVSTTSGVVLRFNCDVQFGNSVNVLSPNVLYLTNSGSAELYFTGNNTANIYQSYTAKDLYYYCKSGTLYFSANNATNIPFKIYGTGVFMANLPSGATQAAAGAAATELWKTSGHATLPDNVVMVGV